MSKNKEINLTIELSPDNDIEAFGAYVNYDGADDAPRILINFKSTLLASADNGLNYRMFFAESVVHEMLHMVQGLFSQAFDEDEVENAILAAREYLSKEGVGDKQFAEGEPYRSYDFCKALNCEALADNKCKADNCLHTAKHFHKWLDANGYQILKLFT